MTSQTYDAKRIALAQLETALTLFHQQGDLFSVVTLAGAAEEILGRLAHRRGFGASAESLAEAASAIHKLLHGEAVPLKEFYRIANRARNSLKHLDINSASTITMDVQQEAVDMLHRAIDNYWLVEQALTPAMEAFARAHPDAN